MPFVQIYRFLMLVSPPPSKKDLILVKNKAAGDVPEHALTEASAGQYIYIIYCIKVRQQKKKWNISVLIENQFQPFFLHILRSFVIPPVNHPSWSPNSIPQHLRRNGSNRDNGSRREASRWVKRSTRMMFHSSVPWTMKCLQVMWQSDDCDCRSDLQKRISKLFLTCAIYYYIISQHLAKNSKLKRFLSHQTFGGHFGSGEQELLGQQLHQDLAVWNALARQKLQVSKAARVRAEQDVQLLANRLRLLRAEEAKSLRIIEEVRKRTREVLETRTGWPSWFWSLVICVIIVVVVRFNKGKKPAFWDDQFLKFRYQ